MRNLMLRALSRFWRDERGIETSEVGWMLLVVLGAVMTVSVVLGDTIAGVFQDVIDNFNQA